MMLNVGAALPGIRCGGERLSYRRNPKIEEAPLQGELMLFDPPSGRFFVLNPTMAFVWRRCDGATSVERIVADLGSEFAAVSPAAASADVSDALAELSSLGLVETADSVQSQV
jgi:hypothetical protein